VIRTRIQVRRTAETRRHPMVNMQSLCQACYHKFLLMDGLFHGAKGHSMEGYELQYSTEGI